MGPDMGEKQPPGGVLKPSQEASAKGLENSRVHLKQSQVSGSAIANQRKRAQSHPRKGSIGRCPAGSSKAP